jgi:hypothetical protein
MNIDEIEKAHELSNQNNNVYVCDGGAFIPDKGWAAILSRESALIAMVRELEKDKAGLVENMGMYEKLIRIKCNSFSLSKNDDHLPNYLTAKDWIEKYEFDDFKDVDQSEIIKMIDSNTIWKLQIYPDTPIGFYMYYGATCEYVIKQAAIESGGEQS